MDKSLRLTAEQKCDIAQREIEEFREELEKLKDESEKVLDTFRVSTYRVAPDLFFPFCIHQLLPQKVTKA